MPKKKVVIGVFSKTPGLSQLKTRLSQTIGKSKAEEFYKLSLNCLKENLSILKNEIDFDLIYLTSEKGSSHSPFWKNENVIEQGEGSFGQKLEYCFSLLFNSYEKVIIIGGDSPGLDFNILKDAISTLDITNYVVGPARDGGFYLIGSRSLISKSVWVKTKYSTNKTLEDLILILNDNEEVSLLPELIDIDYYDDLLAFNSQSKLIAQLHTYKSLFTFIEDTVSK